MELTKSYETAIPEDIRKRYDIRETRNAAVVIAATNPEPFREVLQVLREFKLESDDIVEPGGSKSRVPTRLDTAFRMLGWREGRHDTRIVSLLRIMPYVPKGEHEVKVIEHEVVNPGYKVDNVKPGVAVDIEWHAKDGNLDRDVSAYRALYESGIIDGGIIITRSYEEIRALSEKLGREGGFKTTTTTTLEKLVPRLTRGDGGGCPILAVAITGRCYAP
ncbi:MAG: BglII/BstYI family type II restriction endonuclease [Planctomycetota bacterium]